MPFKVTDSDITRKLVCNFILVNKIKLLYLALFSSYRAILVKLFVLTGDASI